MRAGFAASPRRGLAAASSSERGSRAKPWVNADPLAGRRNAFRRGRAFRRPRRARGGAAPGAAREVFSDGTVEVTVETHPLATQPRFTRHPRVAISLAVEVLRKDVSLFHLKAEVKGTLDGRPLKIAVHCRAGTRKLLWLIPFAKNEWHRFSGLVPAAR